MTVYVRNGLAKKSQGKEFFVGNRYFEFNAN